MTDDPSTPAAPLTRPANPGRRILLDLTDFALLGLLLATILTWLGRFWWVADLFTHFVHYYLAVSIVLVFLLLLQRKRRAAIITIAVLLIHAWTILPTYIPAYQPTSPSASTLTLTHANLLRSNRDRDRALAFLGRCDADLLIVQEMDAWWRQVITESDIPYTFIESRIREDSFGIGLLAHDSLANDSRLTIESTQVTNIGKDIDAREWPAIEATLLLDGRRVKLLSIHPPPPMSSHLARVRNTILQRAKAWANAQTGPHVIIGDLNTTPWSTAFTDLTRDGRLTSSHLGFGNQGTFPAGAPAPWLLPIDHCLHSNDFICTGRDLGEPTGSDHLPIHVTLTLVPELPAFSRDAPDAQTP